MSAPVILPATLSASLPGLVRSFQSLSMIKPMPMFWPLPVKLNPDTVMMSFTSGMDLATPTNASRERLVRSWVAPLGSCSVVMMKPWSSLGRNEVWRLLIITTAPALTARYTTSVTIDLRKMAATQPE